MAVGGVGLSENLFTSLETGGAVVADNIKEVAERIEREEFDMIALGRALIAASQWPNKIAQGQETLPFARAMLGELVCRHDIGGGNVLLGDAEPKGIKGGKDERGKQRPCNNPPEQHDRQR